MIIIIINKKSVKLSSNVQYTIYNIHIDIKYKVYLLYFITEKEVDEYDSE